MKAALKPDGSTDFDTVGGLAPMQSAER